VLAGEAAAADVDFRIGGQRADEAIDVRRPLWSGDAADVSFQGEFLCITLACSFPKWRGGRILPVHVGGSSLAAGRRAGRCGDSYSPDGRLTLEQRAEHITVMRQEQPRPGAIPRRWASAASTNVCPAGACGGTAADLLCALCGPIILGPGAIDGSMATGATHDP